ncbi:BrnT family toxin [Candidatus Palauibacter sp.]|uniref:BrnT family toxin n=1 Tax=Candidatus Palauibacter sp. TaxID=3101350 RepID=UPI003B52FD23
MDFEWDDAKSDDCFRRRGFDFAYAVRAFLDPNRIVGRDRRWDYGEDRYRLLGAIGGRVFVLIYTPRGSAIRIISARKANRKEVREYEHDARED